MSDALEVGVTDRTISEFASEQSYVVLTHDDDFLEPRYTERVSILYYSDDTIESYEIADRVDELTQYVPDPDDLSPITNIGSWE